MRKIAVVILVAVAMVVGVVAGRFVVPQQDVGARSSVTEVERSEGCPGLILGNEGYTVLVYYENPGFSICVLDFEDAVGSYPKAKGLYFETMDQLREAWRKAMSTQRKSAESARPEIPVIPAKDTTGIVVREPERILQWRESYIPAYDTQGVIVSAEN